MDNALSWPELERHCKECRSCSLFETRRNVVFGVGDTGSEIMLIGEGPGEQEDAMGEPFVGRAGKLLDTMLEIIGLSRKNIYIANIVKCRPPNNRDPLNTEQEACIHWLRSQATLLNPKILVCLGRIAAMRIIRPDFKITREHGQWFDKGDIKMMALYHPSALLRDPGKRPETFDDLKALRRGIDDICEREYQLPDTGE